MSQQSLFGDVPDTDPKACPSCRKRFYPSELITNRCSIVGFKGWTRSCPQCFAVVEKKRQKPKFNRQCEEAAAVVRITGSLTDEAFQSVSGFSLRPDLLPWLWLGAMAPGITEELGLRIRGDRDAQYEIGSIKAIATKAYRKCKAVEVAKIAAERRAFVAELCQFAKRMQVRKAKK